MNDRSRRVKRLRYQEDTAKVELLIQRTEMPEIVELINSLMETIAKIVDAIIQALKVESAKALQNYSSSLKENEISGRHQMFNNGPGIQNLGTWKEPSNNYFGTGYQINSASGIWQSQSHNAAGQVGSSGI